MDTFGYTCQQSWSLQGCPQPGILSAHLAADWQWPHHNSPSPAGTAPGRNEPSQTARPAPGLSGSQQVPAQAAASSDSTGPGWCSTLPQVGSGSGDQDQATKSVGSVDPLSSSKLKANDPDNAPALGAHGWIEELEISELSELWILAMLSCLQLLLRKIPEPLYKLWASEPQGARVPGVILSLPQSSIPPASPQSISLGLGNSNPRARGTS